MADEKASSSSNSSSDPRPLMLYNTMTKEKEIFKPKIPGQVGMYVCGVTAYDFSHLGHARAYITFDVLFRYLRSLGYEVTYVRNFTDVDDKIINRANEFKVKNPDDPLSEPLTLSDHYCNEFLRDMDDLQCLHPSHEPRVSDHIEEIIEMIKELFKKDCAYSIDDVGVYFSVDNFERYGELSKRNLEDNRPGERVSVDHRKRNVADFALWKTAKTGEISWPSPWGNGRPGWHIECSAMSAKHLSHSFDIHGGGSDLIFPHHENELAQSCAACEEAHIGYWVHNGFVNINDQKMSKSTGNYFTIRQVTERYHPLAVRYFLLTMHYRSPVNILIEKKNGSPVNFSLPQIEDASNAVFKIYQALQDCSEATKPFQEDVNEKAAQPSESKAKKPKEDFNINMSNDLHIGEILNGSLQDAKKSINTELHGWKDKQEQEKLLAVPSLIELEAAITEILEVLGLLSAQPYSEVLQQLKEKALIRAEMTEDDLSHFIEERAMVRKTKDYAKSDQMRSQMADKGIYLTDTSEGTIWRPCKEDQSDGSKKTNQSDRSKKKVLPDGSKKKAQRDGTNEKSSA